MNYIFLHVFIFIPLIGTLVSFFLPKKNENLISKLAFYTIVIQIITLLIFSFFWIKSGFEDINIKDVTIYKSDNYEFYLDFLFDKITAVYIYVGSFITFLIMRYSQFYMHREKGYKRFFNYMLIFYFGYTIIVLSGNLETLFIGWEILGISSFLLISYYRDRYLPVRNAIKVYSIYRIGDVGLILAMWASHQMWHENISFLKLSNFQLVQQHLVINTNIGIFISLMIVLTACVKSAQWPFSFWLPRAMEGPTPSSAIFYGSLAVNMGVFLLLRTHDFWHHQTSIRILIGVTGLITCLITNSIARVQSSVKSQIAYASISQIGIIFIEVSLGFYTLALIHFAGNAFLRTYQLLVSPSVISYLIREQMYNFVPKALKIDNSWYKKIENSFYILSLKEWNMDSNLDQIYWDRLKKTGKYLSFISTKILICVFIPVFILGSFFLFNQEYIPKVILIYLPVFFVIIGLIMVLKSFAERKSIYLAWITVNLSCIWNILGLSFNHKFEFWHTFIYLSGISVFGLLGFYILSIIKKREKVVDLRKFHGYSYTYPKLSIMFLICCLGVSSFPISPSFIGIDLLFYHINTSQFVLALLLTISFLVNGLSIIRLFSLIFFGINHKNRFEMASRST